MNEVSEKVQKHTRESFSIACDIRTRQKYAFSGNLSAKVIGGGSDGMGSSGSDGSSSSGGGG